MGAFFYSLFLLIYRLGLHLSAPFYKKSRQFLSGRKAVWDHLSKIKGRPVIWVHCASLGEFEQGRPVMEGLRNVFPSHQLVLTFFSPSGYEVRKNYPGADHILYLPLDSRKHARRWVSRLKPSLVLLVKYEFWHHYIKTLSEADIPVLSISSIFRPDQIYFKGWGGFQRRILKRIHYFFVQDQRSYELLHSLGIDQAEVSGDTRFDRVDSITRHPKDLPVIRQFVAGDPVMVIGSAWPADMNVLLPLINTSSFKFIIAPHEIHEPFLQAMENDIRRRCIRLSALEPSTAADYAVLLVDGIGLLSSLYSLGRYAWVGGAYGRGLHNILEASAYGIPVFFGNKNYEKFREAKELITLGGAFAVEDTARLIKKIDELAEEEAYDRVAGINAGYIRANTGATQKIMTYCRNLLK